MERYLFLTSAHLYIRALAIKGNKIPESGGNASIEKFTSPKTKRIYLSATIIRK